MYTKEMLMPKKRFHFQLRDANNTQTAQYVLPNFIMSLEVLLEESEKIKMLALYYFDQSKQKRQKMIVLKKHPTQGNGT